MTRTLSGRRLKRIHAYHSAVFLSAFLLVRSKPAHEAHLTTFYMAIAAGRVTGRASVRPRK